MTTYCDYCNSHPEDIFNRNYHDTEYGFPIDDDNLLFERLVLEINQAGLSWITILKKADNFRKAYHGFNLKKVARYTEQDRGRLLAMQASSGTASRSTRRWSMHRGFSTCRGTWFLPGLVRRALSADKG